MPTLTSGKYGLKLEQTAFESGEGDMCTHEL